MTFDQLQTKIIAKAHRKDLSAQCPGFIEDARIHINGRLTLNLAPLVNPTDTNEVLTAQPLLYFYAGLQSLYEWIEEYETATYFNGLFNVVADRFYVTAPGTEPLVMKSENPAP